VMEIDEMTVDFIEEIAAGGGLGRGAPATDGRAAPGGNGAARDGRAADPAVAARGSAG